MKFRYEAFHRGLLAEDAGFTDKAAPGTTLPEFDLHEVDGGRVLRADYIGTRPLLLTFGSIT